MSLSATPLPAMTLEIRMASVHIDMDSGAFIEASFKALDAIAHEDGSIGLSAAGTLRGSDPTRRWSVAGVTAPFSISDYLQARQGPGYRLGDHIGRQRWWQACSTASGCEPG